MKVFEPVPCPLCGNKISWWRCMVFRTDLLFMKCPSCAGDLTVEFFPLAWKLDLALEMISIILLVLAFAAPVKWWLAGLISWKLSLILIATLFPAVLLLSTATSRPVLHPTSPEQPIPFARRQYFSSYFSMSLLGAGVLLYWNHAAWEAGHAPQGFDLIFLPAAIGYWLFAFWATIEFLHATWTALRTLLLTRATPAVRWQTLARLMPLICLVVTTLGISRIEDQTLRAIPGNARPLVQAIERHIAEKGFPPAKLEALVPEYLKSIPTPGFRIAPTYNYFRYTNPIEEETICWYGLGPGTLSASDAWVFPRPDPNEAVLVLGLDKEEQIRSIYTEGVTPDLVDRPFDPASWAADPAVRQAMARALKDQNWYGKKIQSLEEKIGPARREGLQRKHSWDLRVPITINWNVQYLHPPENRFPQLLYGPQLQGMYEDWAYLYHRSLW